MAPANYSGLANLMNLQGVGVNPTSQLAYVPSKDLMTRYQTIPNPRTGIPQAMGVTGMAEGGMPSEQYPMQEEAMELANRGRYGDTTLVHMTPGEVQGLASLGQLTINPDTGLPEAFSLKSIIPIAASVIGGVVAGPAGAAIGSGLGTLVTGGSAEQALLGAAMSFGMGYAMQGFGGSVFGDLGASAGGVGEAALSGATGFEATAGELAGAFSPEAAATQLINPATNIPTIGASLAAATPQPTMMFDPNLVAPQPTMPSALEMEGYRAGLGDFAPRQDTILEQVTEGVSDVGEGISNIYKDYLSPSRQSIQPTQADITKAFEARASKLQLPSVDNLSVGERSKVLEGLKPSFLKKYGPLGAVGVGGLALAGTFDEEEPEQQQIAKREVDTGFGDYRIVGGEERNPETAKEIQARMLAGGVRPSYFSPTQRYVRNAAEGGIVGLQQGGMATPQAPSAMAGILTQPQPQQPLPINVQVQPQQPVMPQQPQPSMPMPQTGSGVAPLPDQQKEFMKLMDMEDQLQSQKRSQSTQALASLIGLGTDFVSNQYPQTSPSGQAVQPPPTPPMNYGSQVNLGSIGGFAQGGVINRAEGGPTREQFNDFMKSQSNTGVGLFIKLLGMDKQIESQLPVGGGGAESMNQLLSRDVYSNNVGSVAPASVQSPGGAESMNQLLSNPVYSKQAATGGFLGYNQGGMPSQNQPYFEGQVQGPGDGQSDEVAFRVDGGQIDGAMLSPQEYVLAADVVSAIGNGSSDAGAAKLDQFMKGVRQDAYGTTKQMQPFNNQGLTNLVA